MKAIKWIVGAVCALVLLLVAAMCILKIVNHFQYRITTENGIDEELYVDLNGQMQFIRIRGEDINNPVILYLHGGPGSPDGFVGYVWQKDLIGGYTIVTWDQRGCGRTYYKNRGTDPQNDTATFEQAIQDTDALVDYLSQRFGREKIILVGHSYGTMVGSKYALTHPEKLSTYIGVGQVETFESELYSYEDALSKAKAAGDDTTEMMAAIEAFKADPKLETLMKAREYTSMYQQAPREANEIMLGVKSSYMGIDDMRWFFLMSDTEKFYSLNKSLLDYTLAVDVRDFGTSYEIPVGFISGGEDWTTPVKYTQEYCDTISAPKKEFVTIAGCGHSPQLDAPDEFAATLRTMLAGGRGSWFKNTPEPKNQSARGYICTG